MSDRLKSITTIFEDDGSGSPTIKREYKSVHFAGEGAPRDVEITEAERLSLYGEAYARSSALLAETEAAKTDAEGARDEALALAETRQARIDELAAEVAAQA